MSAPSDAVSQLLEDPKRSVAEGPLKQPVPALVAAQARRTPAATALVHDDERVSYAELDERSDRLARHLCGRGVGVDSPVAVSLQRSPELVVALLAVMKAGAAYLPLDPSYPPARLAHVLDDARPSLLLTQRALSSRLPTSPAPVVYVDEIGEAAHAANAVAAQSSADTGPGLPAVRLTDRAYVIYTSGSTGRPKGVEIEHGALTNFLDAMARRPGMAPGDVILGLTSLSFDIAALELFLPLVVGATCVLVPEHLSRDGQGLAALAAASRATVIQATPATWRLLAAEPWPEAASVTALCGGEALPPDLARRLLDRVAALWNLYGPTEATVWSTAARVTRVEEPVPIGYPLANTTAYVLDRALQPVSVGVDGELHLGGAQLARGYLGQPELTARHFITHPQLGRLYRTGDRCRRRSDGALEFVGRVDHQLKIRGFRVEPAEIEAALTRHPAVAQAVVTGHDMVGGETRLVAYVIPAGTAAPTVSALRGALSRTLPEYMVPSVFVTQPVLPLTPNGKVDRAALPAPTSTRPELDVRFRAPRTRTEALLAGIWAEVLWPSAGASDVERVGVDDRFFDLGGDSLLAGQVVARIRAALDIELPLRTLFEQPTVAALAEAVDEHRARHDDASSAPPTRVAHTGDLPVSPGQRGLWLIDQLGPGGAAYVVPLALRLSGALDARALQHSLDELVARHEALRTTFASIDGQPVQRVSPAQPVHLRVTDLTALPADEAAAQTRRLVIEESSRPFDLAAGPLLRAALLRLADGDHVLVVCMHHLVSDDWSLGLICDELAQTYAAAADQQGSLLAPLPLQYADFAVWQQQRLGGGELDRQLAYWREQLAGAPAALDLPTDRPRPPVATFRGATMSFAVERSVTGALRRLAADAGATVFMTALAAFAVLLSRHSGSADVVVGVPVAGRSRPEFEDLVGFFVNTLPLRIDLSGDPSFAELLVRVRNVTLGALDHADVPFERLVTELAPQRHVSRNPLFQVTVALAAHRPANEAAGLRLVSQRVDPSDVPFDLSLELTETPDGIAVALDYATDLFDPLTAERMVGHLGRLLASIAAEPGAPISRLEMLSDEERIDLLVAWNDTARDYPSERPLHALVADHAARSPTAVAVVDGDDTLTYAELDRRANQLAAHLLARGVVADASGSSMRETALSSGSSMRETALSSTSDALVGVCLPRGADLVVALLGILKAGAAYLPLDPGYPAKRLAFMVSDAQARLLVTSRAMLGRLPALDVDVVALDRDADAIRSRPATAPPPADVGGQSLAYVVYTSGSTGMPKGIAIQHRAITRLTCGTDYIQLGPDDVVVQGSNASFDAATFEIWAALTNGAALVILSTDVLLSAPALGKAIVDHDVSVLFLTTAVFNQVAGEDPTVLRPLRHVLFGGEAADAGAVRRVLAEGRPQRLLHMYGPAESTTFATWHLVEDLDAAATTVPIGQPVANTTAFVLDAARVPVPFGIIGELYVGGAGLARGYLHRPQLTAERFVNHPQLGRLYATGDLVRRRGDGALEFVGRVDHQIKLRGFRIEPGEIEANLAEHPGVRDAVVLVRDDRLIAYVVRAVGATPSPGELRAFLAERLPSYLLPGAFVVLDGLPLTPNGKVDQVRLPPPDTQDSDAGPSAAPRTGTQAQVAAIWAELLGLAAVGVHDDFFALGGHSLMATQVIARVRERCGVTVPLSALFQAPTIAGLAAAVDRAGEGAAPSPPPVRRLPREARRR